MQYTAVAKYVHRIPKYLSLFGLFGLAGAAGAIDPRYFWLSFLSFFSFINYFRFFLWFFDPPYRLNAQKVPLVLVAALPIFLASIALPLAHHFPAIGFLGFLGYLGLTLDRSSQVHDSTKDAQPAHPAG